MAEAPVLLWGSEAEELLTYRALIPPLEAALAQFSGGDPAEVLQPVRTTVALGKHSGFMGLMPAYMEKDGVLSTKLVCFYKRAPESPLPGVRSTVLLLDPEVGNVKAVIDGEVITAMRTAAVSAISAKLLMRPDAEVLTIMGTGAQARSHYDIYTELFSFKEVRVWSRNKESGERFIHSVKGPATAYTSAEEAVKGADAIVTVTRSTEAVLFGRWVKPGAHVAAVGACRPDYRELDDVLMKEAVVYVDSRGGAMEESGDVILSGVRRDRSSKPEVWKQTGNGKSASTPHTSAKPGQAEVFAEIGEVIRGTKPALREKTTVFKSLGLGVEDAVSAKLVFDQWQAKKNLL